MAKKYGRCANYGECTLADSHDTIESTEENFVCPECGKPLRVVANLGIEEKTSSKLWKQLLPIALIILGIIGWIIFGLNSDTPAPPPTKTTTSTSANAKDNQDNIILRLHGSNTIGAKLAPALVEAFMKEKGYTKIEKAPLGELEILIRGKKEGSSTFDAIEIKAHGSSTAFDETDENKKVGLIGGYADIGMASNSVSEEIKSKFESSNLGNPTSKAQEHIISLDGVAIIVNPNNPIEKLSLEEIRKIFLGEITDWYVVGGKSGTITLYSRDKQSGTYDIFSTKVLIDKKLECNDNSRNLQCFEDSKALSSSVASDENGIGFIGLNYVGTAKTLKVSMGNTVRAIAPSRFTIKTEDYPLTRRLSFYQTNKSTTLASEFIQFALSEAGQKIVNDTGLVEVAISTKEEDNANVVEDKAYILNDNLIPTAYKDVIRNADRKDTQLNFRFSSGTSNLDNKAFRDVGRLAEKLSQSEFKNAKLILIGFADPKGNDAQNLELSIQRANKVKEELMAEGIVVDTVTGFGEERSLLLDPREDSQESLERNRRVEVWLKR